MNKIWGIIILGFGINGVMKADENINTIQINPAEQWRHIVEVTKNLSHDKEMQEAVQATMTSLQNVLSLGTKKIAHQISTAEKENLVLAVQLLQRMIDISGDSVRTGVTDDETAEELRQLAQELMVIVMPLMFLMQDPTFANEQVKMLQDLRFGLYNTAKRTVATLHNDLQTK